MSDSLKADQTGGDMEYRILLADGSLRWMNDRWAVVRNEQGQAMAISGPDPGHHRTQDG